jgi:MoaA/NifB/PqqE/SkfB family radical SAM enzyme
MLGIKTKILTYLRSRLLIDSELCQLRISPIGYLCNHQCPMCWRTQLPLSMQKKFIHEEINHLNLKEYIHMINGVPKSVQVIEVVGGGEPLLYSRIIELLTLIKQKQIYGRLITNGSLLNMRISQVLVNCAWDEIRISVHAGTSNSYKLINGVDDYGRVMKNIKYLISTRKNSVLPKISLLFVIQHDNVMDIYSFIKQAIRLKVDEIEFDSLIPFTPKKLLLTHKDKNVVMTILQDLQKKLTIKNNIDQALCMFALHDKWNNNIHSRNYFKDKYCQMVQTNLDINSDGTIFPCCLYPRQKHSYNIRKSSVKEAWKYYRLFRKQLASGKFYDFCYQWCNYDLRKR